jgi:hypothetical protein
MISFIKKAACPLTGFFLLKIIFLNFIILANNIFVFFMN